MYTEGFNFHNPLSKEEDVGSNLETHILPGGIEAKFSHALNCWYNVRIPSSSWNT